jgi:hypothetical protein
MSSSKKRKKFDVRKKRAKLLKEQEKQLPKGEREEKKKVKTKREEKLEVKLAKETKLYWSRAITGVLSGLIGSLLGFTSWTLFLWMVIFWLGFPFFTSFIILRYKYKKEEWNWKNILRPGIGIFIFLFLLIAILIFTLRILNLINIS